jgi:hypothetical protein
MSKRSIEYQLQPWVNFEEHLGDDFELVSVSLGPGKELFVLAISKPPDFRKAGKGAAFPKIKPDQPRDYLILRIDESGMHRFDIKEQLWNYHRVQPLPADELLLVCVRSRHYGNDVADQNGRVFGKDGSFRREFLLGDGINRIQTTTDGMIWTGYFDEGVYGNFGWRYPVGASGLVKWTDQGFRVYEYSPPPGIGPIDDCYALNVAWKDNVWCYYYAEFVLIQIRDDQIAGYWHCPVYGADGFIILRDTCLFRGGYDDRDQYHLLELANNHKMKEINRYTFVDEAGQVIQPDRVTARADMMVLVKGTDCYRVHLSELV